MLHRLLRALLNQAMAYHHPTPTLHHQLKHSNLRRSRNISLLKHRSIPRAQLLSHQLNRCRPLNRHPSHRPQRSTYRTIVANHASRVRMHLLPLPLTLLHRVYPARTHLRPHRVVRSRQLLRHSTYMLSEARHRMHPLRLHQLMSPAQHPRTPHKLPRPRTHHLMPNQTLRPNKYRCRPLSSRPRRILSQLRLPPRLQQRNRP